MKFNDLVPGAGAFKGIENMSSENYGCKFDLSTNCKFLLISEVQRGNKKFISQKNASLLINKSQKITENNVKYTLKALTMSEAFRIHAFIFKIQIKIKMLF